MLPRDSPFHYPGEMPRLTCLQVQISFFLKHWGEIKKSDTMMQIWQQIRHGKHVGFEEGMSVSITGLACAACDCAVWLVCCVQ